MYFNLLYFEINLNNFLNFKNEYEMVTSAYSLSDLENVKKRKEKLGVLWSKVKPGGYLVINKA